MAAESVLVKDDCIDGTVHTCERENYAVQLYLEKAAVSREVAKLKHSG